jgi:serine/threonine protein kinase
MEYLEIGDLSTYLRENPPLPENEAKYIAYQVLDGLNMMHRNGFAHRDLKPNVGLFPLNGKTLLLDRKRLVANYVSRTS